VVDSRASRTKWPIPRPSVGIKMRGKMHQVDERNMETIHASKHHKKVVMMQGERWKERGVVGDRIPGRKSGA
jgi:hypothetical protein